MEVIVSFPSETLGLPARLKDAMNIKNPFLQGVALIALALVVAIVSNGFASRQRKLILPGFYPNALKVPPRAPDPVPYPAASAPPAMATTTTVQSPAPGQPPVEMTVPTTTATTTSAAPAAAPTSTAPPAAKIVAAPVPAATATAPKPAEADPLARFTPHPDKPYVELTGDDVALLHARGALFLDARRTSVFEEGHIAGARPFSVWESDVDDKVNALYGERSDPVEQNKPIVIYCSGGACEDSHMLAQKLWGAQFNNVYVYRDGWPDWVRRGGATRTGSQP